MIDCACGFGKDIADDQATCSVCGADVMPLHRLRGLPRHYYNEGIDAANDGRLDFAIESLSTAVSLDEKYCAAHKSLGDIYVKKAMHEEAVRHYAKALQLEPENEMLKQVKQEAETQVARQAAAGRLTDPRRVDTLRKLLVALPVLAFVLGFAIFPTFNLLKQHNVSVPVNYAGLVAQVKQSLGAEPVLKGISIDVAQVGGSVRISGTVPTDVHRRLVAELVQHVVANRMPVAVTLGVAIARQPQPVLYTVRLGDSLSSLAARQYGDGRMWIKIYAANRDKLSSPNGLLVGQVLVIPE